MVPYLLLLTTLLLICNADLCLKVKKELQNNKEKAKTYAQCSINCNSVGQHCNSVLGEFFGLTSTFRFEKKTKCKGKGGKFSYICSQEEPFYKAEIEPALLGADVKKIIPSIVQCTQDMKLTCVGNAYACKVPKHTDVKTIPLTIDTITDGKVQAEYRQDKKFGGGMYVFPIQTPCAAKKKQTIAFSKIKDKVTLYYEIKNMVQSPKHEYYCGNAPRDYSPDQKGFFIHRKKVNPFFDKVKNERVEAGEIDKLLVAPDLAIGEAYGSLFCFTTKYVWEKFHDSVLQNEGFAKLILPESFEHLFEVKYPFLYQELSLAMKKITPEALDEYNKHPPGYDVEIYDKYAEEYFTSFLEEASWNKTSPEMYVLAERLAKLNKNGETEKVKDIIKKMKKLKIKYTLFILRLKCNENSMSKTPELIQQSHWQTIPYNLIKENIYDLWTIHHQFGYKEGEINTVMGDRPAGVPYTNSISCRLAECKLIFKRDKAFDPQTKLSIFIKKAKLLNDKMAKALYTAHSNDIEYSMQYDYEGQSMDEYEYINVEILVTAFVYTLGVILLCCCSFLCGGAFGHIVSVIIQRRKVNGSIL
eukprot:63571_1